MMQFQKDYNFVEEELEQASKNNQHSLLLYLVWKKGIPGRIRKKIWPIAIKNDLKITNNLFIQLQTQSTKFLKRAQVDLNLQPMINSLKHDLEKVIFKRIPAFKTNTRK